MASSRLLHNKEGMMPAKKTQNSSSPIPQQKEFFVGVEIAGTSDLIQSAFSQKTIEEMLRKHMGFSVHKEPKKPRDLIERAIIRNVKGDVCIPVMAIKKGMLTASLPIKSLKKTQLRPMLRVEGNAIPITYEEMVPRMDMVRLAGVSRTPDVRFRPMFTGWKARMIISFDDALKVETVIDLLNRAGKVGVGEWRPERDGTFGTYKVVRNIIDKKELDEVREACEPPLEPIRIPDWAMDEELSPDIMKKIAASEEAHSEEETEDKKDESEDRKTA
jgi:hypothetical protein